MFFEIEDVIKIKNNLKYPKCGEVVFNEDPEGLGRVKVIIKGLLEDISDNYNKLPWINCIRPDEYSLDPPKVGSLLRINFYGDIYTSVYDGYWLTEKNSPFISEELSAIWKDDYPYVYGFEDEVGNYEIINKAKGFTERKYSSDVKIRIDNEGNITQDVIKDYTNNISGKGIINSSDLNLGDKNNVTKKLVNEDHLPKFDSLIDEINTVINNINTMWIAQGNANPLFLPVATQFGLTVLTPWLTKYLTLKENGINKTNNTKAN